MLKEKNLQVAMDLVEKNPTGKMTAEQVADMIAESIVAEREYNKIANEVKEFYNTVYEPMCARKREAEIKMHELRLRIEQIQNQNVAQDALVKRVLMAVKKAK